MPKTNLKLVNTDEGGAIPPARAGREPSPLRVSALAGDHRLSRLAPVFTHRVHKAPLAHGHRAFSLGKAEWR